MNRRTPKGKPMRYFFQQIFDTMMMPVRAFFSAPGRIFASSKRVFGVSLPARVAFFVALFLVICVVVSYLVFYRAEGRPFMGSKWKSIPVISVLVVAIQLVVYKLLKVWLEGDIDRKSVV